MGLSACVGAVPPQPNRVSPELPASFRHAPNDTAHATMDALLPINDPAFAQLRAAALEAGTMQAALARVEAARASARGARAARMPEIGIGADVTGSRSNPDQFGSALPPGVAIDSSRVAFGATTTARWDADLFGRLRAESRAAEAQSAAAAATAEAVRIALETEVAAALVDWRTLDARDSAIGADIAAAQALARLAQVRESAGIAPAFDRIRAEALTAATLRRRATLASERARLLGRMVALTGFGASQIEAIMALPPAAAFSAAPPQSLPSDLLRNRPDVLAAAARLAAADQRVAAAAARRFPRLTLSGALGLLAFSLGDVFGSNALVGALGADIAAPLLDFGRIAAAVDRNNAEAHAAFEELRAAVFTALGDAEGGYALIAASDAELLAANAEAALGQRQAELAAVRYQAGLADFLTVLEARRAANGGQEAVAAAGGRAQRARILLWQALGGSR